MLTLETVTETPRFAALRAEWDDLIRNSASDCLFLSWEWLYSWWTTTTPRAELQLVTVRSDGRLVGLAPWMRQRPLAQMTIPFRSLAFLGTGTAGSDYLDVIVRSGWEDACRDVFAGAMAGSRDMIRLAQLNPKAASAVAVADELVRRGWTRTASPVNRCPYIDLEGHDWDSYLRSLSAAHRANFNRRVRQLNRRYSLRFQLARNERERATLLEQLFALHGLRWNPRGGSNGLGDPAVLRFHRRFSRLALARGWLRLFVLYLDDHPAAGMYAFRYRNRYLFYQSGFDPRFANYSVGLVTLGFTIRQSFDEGCREFDLLHGGERYKSHWSTGARTLVQIDAFPPGLRGLACRQLIRLRSKCVSLVRGLHRDLAAVDARQLPTAAA